MRNTSRVQSEGGAFDAATTAEVAVDVVEHFVAVDVAVVVGDGDRQRVIVLLVWLTRSRSCSEAFTVSLI
jgi:hypothetical protein